MTSSNSNDHRASRQHAGDQSYTSNLSTLTGQQLIFFAPAIVIITGTAALVVARQLGGVNWRFVYSATGDQQIFWLGLLHELGLLVIATTAIAIILYSSFREESMSAVGIKTGTDDSPNQSSNLRSSARPLTLIANLGNYLLVPRRFARVTFILFSLLSIITLKEFVEVDSGSRPYSHLSFLIQKKLLNEERLPEEYDRARRGFRAYMVYASMFRSVLYPLLIAIPLATFIRRDVPKLNRSLKQLDVIRSRGERAIQFKLYVDAIKSLVPRYLDVVGVVAGIELFRILYGRFVTIENTNATSFSAVTTMVSTVLFLAVVWWLYFRAYRIVENLSSVEQTTQILTSENTSPPIPMEPWTPPVAPITFVRQLLQARPSGYLVIALTVFSPQARSIMTDLLKVASGGFF